MSDLQRIPTGKENITIAQENYNVKTKKLIHLLGTNIALFIAGLLPIFLIGYIWTDFGVPDFGIKFITDGIATVLLFVIGETTMMHVGKSGGKLDSDYIAARQEYSTLVAEVNRVGTMLMAVFCEWTIARELEQAMSIRVRSLRMTRADFEKVKTMPRVEIEQKYGHKKAKAILKVIELDPIELNEAILLFDEAEGMTRGNVPISGEGYLRKKSHSIETVLSCIFTGLLTVTVAITMTSDITFARVMYTIYKLIVLFYRMAMGYSTGARAFNSIEVRQLQSKSNYLRQYLRFVEDKTYTKIGDKYGDVSPFIDTPENVAEAQQSVA